MSEHEFESYLGLLTRFLRLDARQRDDIRRELRAHMEEAIDEQMSRGASREDAIKQALEDFGDAAELAARFSKIGWKKRWIMRGTAVAASIGIVAIWSVFSTNEPAGRVLAEEGKSSQSRSFETSHRLHGVPLGEITLDEKKVTVDYHDVALEAAIQKLVEQAGLNCHVFWQTLELQGIERDRVVSLSLRDVPFQQALDLLLREASNDAPIFHRIDDGVVLVSARSDLPTPKLETRFYEVYDLIPDWNPLLMTNPRETANKIYEYHIENLMDAIRRFVEPDEWDVNGGSGDISDMQGVLLVRQTAEVHHKVDLMLQRLREMRPISDSAGQQSAANGSEISEG